MNILFVIDGALDPFGASPVLARRLCDELAAMGHSITILESTTGKASSAVKNVRRCFFVEQKEKALVNHIHNQQRAGRSMMAAGLSLLAKPRLFIVALRWVVFNKRPLVTVCKKHIEKVLEEQQFDVVIAAGAPHYTSIALLKAHVSCAKAAYWTDPFPKTDFLGFRSMKKTEQQIYQNFSTIFITPLMMQESQLYPSSNSAAKFVSLAFPNLVNRIQPPLAIRGNQDQTIRLAYVGRFVEKIRPATPLFRLFENLPNEFNLIVVGSSDYDPGAPSLEKQGEALGARLSITGFIPQEEAFEQMKKADILINVGNENTNQLPSKLHDYISTGKPILNFYKSKGCPSLPVLQQYPLALSVREGDLSEETLEQIIQFCRQAAGKAVPFEIIQQLYYENTPESVAKVVLSALSGC